VALALRYAAGVLGGAEAAAFERRLGASQAARDALCQAVVLAQALAGRGPLEPGPGYRERVRQRLQALPMGAPAGAEPVSLNRLP
jgi:hypothetical protein